MISISSPPTPAIRPLKNRATRFPSSSKLSENARKPPISLPTKSAYFPLPADSPTTPTHHHHHHDDDHPYLNQATAASSTRNDCYTEPLSFHQVEPRNMVPRPFTLDGYSVPPSTSTSGTGNFTTSTPYHPQLPQLPRRTTYAMSHDPNALEFPSTLDILWDRSPLRTPIIIPHERLLPSLWVSRQTMVSLGQSVAYLQSQAKGNEETKETKESKESKENQHHQPLESIGLLIGRASFPGRTVHPPNGYQQQQLNVPPTFMADARPVVCLDMFDPGRKVFHAGRDEGDTNEHLLCNNSTILVPSNETLVTAPDVVMIPVKRHTTLSTTATASTTTLAISRDTAAAHIVDLADACRYVFLVLNVLFEFCLL